MNEITKMSGNFQKSSVIIVVFVASSMLTESEQVAINIRLENFDLCLKLASSPYQ